MSVSAGPDTIVWAVHNRPLPDPMRKVSRKLTGWALAAGTWTNKTKAVRAATPRRIRELVIAVVPVAVAVIVIVTVTVPEDGVRAAGHRLLDQRIVGKAGVDELVVRAGQRNDDVRIADWLLDDVAAARNIRARSAHAADAGVDLAGVELGCVGVAAPGRALL